MIPLELHFVWVGGPMPAFAKRHLALWASINPRHKITVHNESSCPDDLRDRMDAAGELCSKADVIRLGVLRDRGGWALDLDFYPLRPIEDAERGFQLDGEKIFISKQQGSRGQAPYANGVMACGKGCEAMVGLCERLKNRGYSGRTAFGPELVQEALAAHRGWFAIGEAGWWFPIEHSQTRAAYPYLAAGRVDALDLTRRGTAGQQPIAAHLWASVEDLDAYATEVLEHKVALVHQVSILRDDHPLQCIARGLRGREWEVVENFTDSLRRVDLVVVWNGETGPSLEMRQEAERRGVPVLFVEHGFFRRGVHSQLDLWGNLHRSSWATKVSEPAPPLHCWVHDKPRPAAKRPSGYVLVLGQVPNDTQLAESELKGPYPLQQAVRRALSDGVEVYFRPHPTQSHAAEHPNHDEALPRLGEVISETGAYGKTFCGGESLAEALEGARFVITINSNAHTEAMMAGVPCLLLGPSLAINAGAARGASLRTLKRDIAVMLAGWTPDNGAVRNYIRWLAAKQWHNDELQDPERLGQVLAELGVIE